MYIIRKSLIDVAKFICPFESYSDGTYHTTLQRQE